MTTVNVREKNAEIDGKPIKWFVLAISGTLDGIEHTLEIKLSRTEKMLADILLKSKENLQTVVKGKISVQDEQDFLEA